ncbi:hypothetical protein BST61_g4852 [Cercospora zeina]
MLLQPPLTETSHLVTSDHPVLPPSWPKEFAEQPRKLRGRQRLLAGLHRISSSPSIPKLNTSRSRGYHGNGKGSISCISLNSATTYGTALDREHAAGYATTPASAVTTPGVQGPPLDEAARVRYLLQHEGKLSVGLPADYRSSVKAALEPGIIEVDEDYFSRPVAQRRPPRRDVNFWRYLPSELKMEILTYLEPKEIVRCSTVSKSWHQMCFDGQLWAILDTTGFYQDIPGDALVRIITAAGPFVRDLNLRGCVQLRERWNYRGLSDACTNLENFSLEGCRIDRASIHNFLWSNSRLIHINLSGLAGATNAVLIEGTDSEIDYITGRPMVPPRRFKHLDLTRCRLITDKGVRTFVNNIPDIEGLQLSKCHGILDATLTDLLPTVPMLTHLDLEELEDLSNNTLHALASAPCAGRLRHLSISYCESMGDVGMLPVIKACTSLRSVEMDNTRIGDLVLAEAASMVRQRSGRTTIHGAAASAFMPVVGLRLVAYDCQNVTWTGVREILSRNADISITSHPQTLPGGDVAKQQEMQIVRTSTFPTEVIQLKCFYTYQPTVEEHFKRVMRGDFVAARRLERKWAEFMIAQEEASTNGGGRHRRQRRARQAQLLHADEEEDAHAPGIGVGGGRRRRARSGGCAVM